MHWGFFCLWHWSFVFGLHTLCILSSLWCAFIGAWVFCSHAWTVVNSRLRLETGQLEHVSSHRTAVQSCVLSWRAPGSSAVAKNTGIGNRVLVEGSKWENPPPPPRKKAEYPERHQTGGNGELMQLHCKPGTIKLSSSPFRLKSPKVVLSLSV